MTLSRRAVLRMAAGLAAAHHWRARPRAPKNRLRNDVYADTY